MALEYFPCYHSYQAKLQRLSDAEVGRLFRALLRYSAGGAAEPPEGPEGLAYDFMVQDIDRARANYAETCAQNRRNGKRGGRPKKQPRQPEADAPDAQGVPEPDVQEAPGAVCEAAPAPSCEASPAPVRGTPGAAAPSAVPAQGVPGGPQASGEAPKNRAVFFDPSKTQSKSENKSKSKSKNESESEEAAAVAAGAAAAAAAPPCADKGERLDTGPSPDAGPTMAAEPSASAGLPADANPSAATGPSAPANPPADAAPSIAGAAAFFEQNGFGRAAPAIREELRQYRQAGCSEALLITAMHEALDHGCPRWAYARKVLERCRAEGITDTAGFAARGRPGAGRAAPSGPASGRAAPSGFGRNVRVDRPSPSGHNFLPHGKRSPLRLHQSGPAVPQSYRSAVSRVPASLSPPSGSSSGSS